jgi:hypothetical protein
MKSNVIITGVIKNTRMLLLGVILTLLPLSAEAKNVYSAVVSDGILENLPNLEPLDMVIKTNDKKLDQIFKDTVNDRLVLPSDK